MPKPKKKGEPVNTVSEHPSVFVDPDELDDLLDVFSISNLTLREESSLAAQCFDDLCSYCPDQLAFDTPLPNIDADRANREFAYLLTRLGITDAQELAAATDVDPTSCAAVLGDPVNCSPIARRAVVEGLENSMCEQLWNTDSGLGWGTVGDVLSTWTRQYFRTPFAFAEQALSFNLKCRLVGAVSGLSTEEIWALAETDATAILKYAAHSASLS